MSPSPPGAGPVSFALGGEYDRNASEGSANPTAIAAGFSTGNFGPTTGAYHTYEGFSRDLDSARQGSARGQVARLQCRGCAPATSALSGNVLTWKLWGDVGAGRRLPFPLHPVTRHALAQPGRVVRHRVVCQCHLQQSVASKPEGQQRSERRGQSDRGTGEGGYDGPRHSLSAHVLSGLSASFDYYKIKIIDSLVSLSAQTTINDCYTYGTFCSNVVQDAAHNISVVYLRRKTPRAPGRRASMWRQATS